MSYHTTVHKDLSFVYNNDYRKCIAVRMWLARADPFEKWNYYINNKNHEILVIV